MNDENELTGKIIQPVPKEEENIGVDTQNEFANIILAAAQTDQLDISKIENFTTVAKSREALYQLIDTMGEDNLINFLIECYAEDATQRSESGHVVWIESDDPKVQAYGQYLLDVLQIDKDAYSHMFSLIKYGDLYLRMYRESDFEEDDIFDEDEADKKQSLVESKYTDIKEEGSKETLTEDVIMKLHSKQDHYANYVEPVDNPGEMSELTKRGKTMGFIKAPYDVYRAKNINTGIGTALLDTTWSYDIAKDDVEVFPATEFVHIYLNDTSSRTPEEVNIFTTKDKDGNLDGKHTYNVKRGKSLLYDWFKAWREMTLLENSIILNRLTKSATTKVFKVPVGDMSKNEIRAHLQGIKQLFEQKSAMSSGNGMWEYNNPGPIENSVFIPVYEGKGDITVDTVGGEYDPKNLTDLEHFRDKFFSGTGVPKQFCLRGNTKIQLLNGETVTIEYMYLHRDEYINKGILGCNIDGSLQPTTIKDIMLTKPNTDFLRIYLDNGEYVDVTDDHLMMLRDGSFIEAKYISVGDSLMPYYTKEVRGRKYVLDNEEGKYKPLYRVVAEEKFGEIAKGNQIHHLDCDKHNDDFDNLANLTLQEHYDIHKDMLHNNNKMKSELRRQMGGGNKHKGDRMITNGIESHWLHKDEPMPEGYTYGSSYFSEEKRREYGDRLASCIKANPELYSFGGYKKGDAKEDTIKHCKEARKRYFENMSEEDREAYHNKYKGIINANREKMVQCRTNKLLESNPGVVQTTRYTRCPVCNQITSRRISNNDYNSYLQGDKFYYCCKDHEKEINGGGKLGRSYRLLKENGFDYALYDEARLHQEIRRDAYYLTSTLKRINDNYLVDYVPECNHKVVKIERLNVTEPSYDITVNDDCHTFALDCGIFVHNCGFTDDAAGFNGGSSLTIISSKYGKKVIKFQDAYIYGITDLLNLLFLDRGLKAYVNNFTIKMVRPITKEEIDNKEQKANNIALLRDTMDVLQDIDDKPTRLKILVSFLKSVLDDTDVLNILNEYVEKVEEEQEENPTPTNENEETEARAPRGGASMRDIGRNLGIEPQEEEEAPTEMETGTETTTTSTETTTTEETPTTGGSDYLPSGEELGIDLT